MVITTFIAMVSGMGMVLGLVGVFHPIISVALIILSLVLFVLCLCTANIYRGRSEILNEECRNANMRIYVLRNAILRQQFQRGNFPQGPPRPSKEEGEEWRTGEGIFGKDDNI